MGSPSLQDFHDRAEKLAGRIHKTPVHAWDTALKTKLLGETTKPVFKLELFQKTGSFKIRGALSVIDHMSAAEKSRGIVAGTGGNHGIAVAHAAKSACLHAKIIVPRTINPFRKKAILDIGADLVEVENIALVLDEMLRVAKEESRTVLHPFENPYITLGTGTLGVEFLAQVPDLEAVIVPIGGGLASGVACAVKQINPRCKVYGVEPAGANSMSLSFKAGHAVSLPGGPKSIADSLSSPRAEPYSFSLCQKYLDDIVLIEDDGMRQAMRILFEDCKLAVEPAGAAATAALLGPLKERCDGLRTGIIVCGSNIDLESFFKLAS